MVEDQHWLNYAKKHHLEHKLEKSWGTWDGHIDFYDKRRDELNELLKKFDEDNNCDDKNDPHGYGVEASYTLALEYAQKEPPEEPKSKEGQTSPPWVRSQIEELGGKLVDGAIIVGKNVTAAGVVALKIIATILFIPLKWVNDSIYGSHGI